MRPFRFASLCLLVLCSIPSCSLATADSVADVDHLRKEIFVKTGIRAVNYPVPLDASVLAIVEKVLISGLPEGGARKLRALSFVGGQPLGQDLTRTDATYSFKDKFIAISVPSIQAQNRLQGDLFATIAHEVGHAAAFSFLTGTELEQFAKNYGPWKKLPTFDGTIISLWDTRLRQRHPDFETPIDALRSQLGVPSRYALESAHEWFAEVFSAWAMENIQTTTGAKTDFYGRFSVPPKTAQALANLFDRSAE